MGALPEIIKDIQYITTKEAIMLEIFYFDKNRVKPGAIKDLPKLKRKKIWVDCTAITKDEAKLLKEIFRLHPLTKEDLLQSPTRIKVEEFPNYLFCVFYGVHKNRTVELIEFDYVLGKRFLISNHLKEIQTINELKHNMEKLTKLFNKGLDFLFHKLVDNEVDNYFPVIEQIDNQVEIMQESVPTSPDPKFIVKLTRLKRSIVYVKRSAYHLREKLSFLAKIEYSFLSEKVVPYFRDVYDHSIKIVDAIDNQREAISTTYESYMMSINNHMNQVMKVLGIIATITLPITALSGVYGTNFAYLPGSQSPHGFWVMVIFMFFISVIMIIYFRKNGWF